MPLASGTVSYLSQTRLPRKLDQRAAKLGDARARVVAACLASVAVRCGAGARVTMRACWCTVTGFSGADVHAGALCRRRPPRTESCAARHLIPALRIALRSVIKCAMLQRGSHIAPSREALQQYLSGQRADFEQSVSATSAPLSSSASLRYH